MTNRVRVEYADHNEAFASYLPRSGTLVRQCTDVHDNQDWFLMKLDEPFDYQLKKGEPFQFRLINVGHFLLRSRSQAYAMGSPEATPVFVLLVEDSDPAVPNPFDPASYVHIAWGMCMAQT